MRQPESGLQRSSQRSRSRYLSGKQLLKLEPPSSGALRRSTPDNFEAAVRSCPALEASPANSVSWMKISRFRHGPPHLHACLGSGQTFDSPPTIPQRQVARWGWPQSAIPVDFGCAAHEFLWAALIFIARRERKTIARFSLAREVNNASRSIKAERTYWC